MRLKYSEFIKIAKNQGCYFYKPGKKHDLWKNPDGKTMPIPRHGSQEVPDGTLSTLFKWAGVK